MIRGKVLGIIVVLFCSLLLISCGGEKAENTKLQNRTAGFHVDKQVLQKEFKESFELKKEISIAAIGDMLIHNSVYNDAKKEHGYDFKPMMERVKPYLSNATISIANQETMIGGEELGLSSYPAFNSPKEVGDVLKWAGVNVVTLANNHTLDRGEVAIQQAIKHWEAIDMTYTGAYKDNQDRDQIRVVETDEGISVAILSYTYGTNGIPVPEGKDYLVNLIDRELIASEIKEARKLADIVVLGLHFGNEYERLPNQAQKDLVQFVADEGADVILGHHPHVLQPIEWVSGKDGDPTLVIYSLGNFLSGQDEYYRQVGGIFKFYVSKTIKGGEVTIEVHSPEFLPTYVKYENWRDYEVIPMYQLTNEELPNVKERYKEIKDHMSMWLPELKFIENEEM